MTLKVGAKFEEKLTCGFKNYKINLLKFSAKKSTEELCFMTLKRDAEFKENLTCGLKNDMRGFDKFSPKHLQISKLSL